MLYSWKHLNLLQQQIKYLRFFIESSSDSNGTRQIICSHRSHIQPKQLQVSACTPSTPHVTLQGKTMSPSLFSRFCFSDGFKSSNKRCTWFHFCSTLLEGVSPCLTLINEFEKILLQFNMFLHVCQVMEMFHCSFFLFFFLHLSQ